MRSLTTEHVLRTLGSDLREARIRRRIPMQDFAERMGVDRKTVMRLERGEPGVSIGTLAAALLILGEEKRLAALLDPGSDDVGLLIDRAHRPRRVQARRPARSGTDAASPEDMPSGDEFGVGF